MRAGSHSTARTLCASTTRHASTNTVSPRSTQCPAEILQPQSRHALINARALAPIRAPRTPHSRPRRFKPQRLQDAGQNRLYGVSPLMQFRLCYAKDSRRFAHRLPTGDAKKNSRNHQAVAPGRGQVDSILRHLASDSVGADAIVGGPPRSALPQPSSIFFGTDSYVRKGRGAVIAPAPECFEASPLETLNDAPFSFRHALHPPGAGE